MAPIFGVNPNNRAFLAAYVLGMHGLGSLVISGGLEFAIAYGMYKNSNQDVTLWAFPNTISGDCALTVFIQCVVTWVLEEVLIGFDIYNDAVPNFNIVGRPKNKYVLTYMEIVDRKDEYWNQRLFRFIPGTKQVDYKTVKPEFLLDPAVGDPPHSKQKWRRGFMVIFLWLVNKALRALMMGVLLWTIIWPITMGILAGIGRSKGKIDYTFNHFPEPQIIKLLYGGILGLFCTPMMASVILMRYYYSKQTDVGMTDTDKSAEDSTDPGTLNGDEV